MTISEILESEKKNTGAIILYKEGMFHKTYELCYHVRFCYDIPDSRKGEWVVNALWIVREAEYLLKILKELKEVGLSHYTLCCELLSSVSRQLGLLHQKVMAKVDAAND